MRGQKEQQATMLLGLAPDDFVPADHPIRAIRAMVDRVLAEVSPQFTEMYARIGRPSVPPEHLVKASLLMALYSIPSERQFCERLRYDLLFKWFRAPRGAMSPRGLRGPPPVAAAAGRS